MTNPDDLAYPVYFHHENFENAFHNGLSKRELFSAMILQGMHASTNGSVFESYVSMAVKEADALIEALNKKKGGE